MKCPYCSKEIKDDAVFCGFCGKQIPQVPPEEISPLSPPNEVKTEISSKNDNIPAENSGKIPQKKVKDKPKKKRTALKVLLRFVLLSFLSGSVLGFLTARDLVSLDSLMPNNRFKWTNLSEGQAETTPPNDSLKDKENEKEESSESSIPTDEETPTSLTEPTDLSSVPASSEESQAPTEHD